MGSSPGLGTAHNRVLTEKLVAEYDMVLSVFSLLQSCSKLQKCMWLKICWGGVGSNFGRLLELAFLNQIFLSNLESNLVCRPQV